MKKIFVILLLGSLLVGCSSTPKEPEVEKVYESVTLPYVLLEKDDNLFVDETGKYLRSEITIRSVTVRDLTTEENELFLVEMNISDNKDLNDDYRIVEVDFGEGVIVYGHMRDNYFFFLNPQIILGDEVLYDIDIKDYVHIAEFIRVEGKARGEKISSRKLLCLVPKENLKKGSQLKLSEDVYLDLDVGK